MPAITTKQASRTGEEAEANAARRSAEIGLARACKEVARIMQAKPCVGELVLKHLEHLGLRSISGDLE